MVKLYSESYSFLLQEPFTLAACSSTAFFSSSVPNRSTLLSSSLSAAGAANNGLAFFQMDLFHFVFGGRVCCERAMNILQRLLVLVTERWVWFFALITERWAINIIGGINLSYIVSVNINTSI